MTSPLLAGFALILLSSVAGGVFAAPLRRRRVVSVELMWLVVFLVGYLLIPHAVAGLLLPGWRTAVGQVGSAGLGPALVLGAAWGSASLLFAHGIARMGVSFGFAVILGLIIAVGASLPLLRHWAELPVSAQVGAVTGILLCLLGVALCGRAGLLRDGAGACRGDRGFGIGLTLCVLSGIFSACANLGFEYAAPVARAFGTRVHPVLASIARWLPVYWGGAAVVVAYTVARTTRRREWGLLTAPGGPRDLAWALLAGSILPLGLLPYGMGAHLLGPLGTSVGYAVNTGAMLLVASLVGLWLGEWRQAPAAARRWLGVGLATLAVALVVLAALAT